MRGAILLPIFLNLATPAEAQPRSLGIFFQWGAFEEGNHCFAIAEPERSPRPRDWKPFASIGYWPGPGVRGQLHIRLSRPKREGSAVLLKIDDRTWQLIGGGNNAWAPDRPADAALVAPMSPAAARTIAPRTHLRPRAP